MMITATRGDAQSIAGVLVSTATRGDAQSIAAATHLARTRRARSWSAAVTAAATTCSACPGPVAAPHESVCGRLWVGEQEAASAVPCTAEPATRTRTARVLLRRGGGAGTTTCASPPRRSWSGRACSTVHKQNGRVQVLPTGVTEGRACTRGGTMMGGNDGAA